MQTDSQYFPQGGDLFVHHLFLFHSVSIKVLQVSFSKQRTKTHHLLVPVETHGHEVNLRNSSSDLKTMFSTE